MSLINDALKKAQHRHGDSTPATPSAAGPAAIPSAPRKGKNPFGKIVLICAGIALLSAAVSVTVILLVVRDEKPAPLAPPIGAPSPQPAPASPASPVATTPAITQPSTPPASPASTETPVQPAPASPVVSLPLPAPEPAAPVAPAIKIGTRIQAFTDRLRITSIRISDTGNKVILNDRLFRVNDLVEPSLGLRLTDIQPKQLIFTDESGNTYLRHF